MNRAVVWSGMEAAGSALFSVAGAFAVARLIGPEALGIGAAAVAVHVLLWVVVNGLFADAIVQRDAIDAPLVASAVWASAAVGCAAAGVQIGAGWVLMAVLGDPRLPAMALVLAVPLPLVGAAGAVQGLLTRGRRYGVLAARTLIGQGLGMVAGVALALTGWGPWAPVGQQAAGSLIAALVLLFAGGWRPVARCRWSDVRTLLRVGLPLSASTLVQIGRYRLFVILIGGTAGPAALGQIHMAFRLVDTMREVLFSALWRLMLPILSECQHDRAARLRAVDRLLRRSAWVTLPAAGALACGLVPLTMLLLGSAWRDAGEAAMPLTGLMAILALMFPSGAALAAVGQARFTLYANLAGLAATVGLVLAVRPEAPWAAVLTWCGAQLAVTPPSLWVNGRALGVGPFRPLRAGTLMLVASLAGLAAALMLDPAPPLVGLTRRECAFALAGGLVLLLARWRALIPPTTMGGPVDDPQPGWRSRS